VAAAGFESSSRRYRAGPDGARRPLRGARRGTRWSKATGDVRLTRRGGAGAGFAPAELLFVASEQSGHGISSDGRYGGSWQEYPWDSVRAAPVMGQGRAIAATDPPGRKPLAFPQLTDRHGVKVAGTRPVRKTTTRMAPAAEPRAAPEGPAELYPHPPTPDPASGVGGRQQ